MNMPVKPKLLIVEDDEGLQRQLRWAYDDYEVLVASDRDAAINLVRATEPAVVTLDLGLPPDPDGVTEGFAALESILALKPETKVIVASGHGARESARRAPARSCSRADCTRRSGAAAAASSRSTARRSPRICSRPNCSAMRRAPS